ncbi:MAG: response regulator [Gemmatimonadaceae bacterium]|nr:response regulator [Gemmatimonadaceae bacterium]
MVEVRNRLPLVLIASHGEWLGRSVESVLELNNYTALRVDDGRRALDLARHVSPDVVILDTGLTEIDGITVCRALTDDPLFDHSTPIFIISPAPTSNRVRMEAFEAGAWDFSTQPVDTEGILLKMATFLRARRRLEDVESTSLIDPSTGLYSSRGLRHWAAQLGARASRNHEPLACVVVTSNRTADSATTAKPVSAALSYMADLCRSKSRKSDVVGYVGESRFAILAPHTDEAGARQFVGRLQRALEGSASGGEADGQVALHAGFYAVADFGASGVDATDVVGRAESALQYVLSGAGGSATSSFADLPVN